MVKVGTSTLTHENGAMNLKRIEQLVRTLSDLKNEGREIILVTSAAIVAGACKLRLSARPQSMPEKQAAAAVGQCELMHIYDKMFEEYSHTVGQVLLSRDVTGTPEGTQNVRNTFEALLDFGAIPIVNENDTVATEEIAFGDNDTLSAIVARIVGADLLILLSDIDGLYDSDPHENPGARLIPVVYELTDAIITLAGGAGVRGTGGMVTKIHAAEQVLPAGIPMIIANGENPEILYDILSDRHKGTLFLPQCAQE